MQGKIMFVAGAAVGYVLGARAGRRRYEQIKAAADKAWHLPVVQRGVHQAQGYVKERAAELPGVVWDGARFVVIRVRRGAAAKHQADVTEARA